MDVLATVGVAIGVFTSTNIDDILLLAAFFSDPKFTRRNIVIGQFIGIGLLVLVSAVAALAALVIPHGYTALLGVVPLALGLRRLVALRRPAEDDETHTMDEEQGVERRTRSQLLAVSSVTVVNGGDNLGVYIPLFAQQPGALPVYVAVFAVMTALWCLAGYLLVNNPLFGTTLRRVGRVALPFVLIALGLYILSALIV